MKLDMSSPDSGLAESKKQTSAFDKLKQTIPVWETFGFGAAIAGIVGIIISLLLQFFIIDHGSSNQLTIDAEVQKTGWGVLGCIILFILGFILWLLFSTFRNKYLPVFILSLVSYIAANIAMVLSLYQVTITKT